MRKLTKKQKVEKYFANQAKYKETRKEICKINKTSGVNILRQKLYELRKENEELFIGITIK